MATEEDEKKYHLKFKSLIIGSFVLFETFILLLMAMFDLTLIMTSMIVEYRVNIVGNQTILLCNSSTVLALDDGVFPKVYLHHPFG